MAQDKKVIMNRKQPVTLTGVERMFGKDEIIVSKTDLKGHIVYGNRLFYRLAGYPEARLIGAPHCIIRHPDMPHCVFKLLWDTIQAGREIFAYVINRSVNGDHYWVLAHVTPSYDKDGKIDGYHSNRRVPDRNVLNQTIIPLYKALKDEEARYDNVKDGIAAGTKLLMKILNEKGLRYDEFVFALLRAA